ncbi:phospholipase D/nuclease, partial [Yamadazyma tenuis ATCC 10573]
MSQEAKIGYSVGRSIHFDYTSRLNRSNYEQNIKPYLCKWNNGHEYTGRERNPAHVKLYMCDNGDDFKSLKWLYMGSHNLSKQAWGGGSGFGSWQNINEYQVSSYELGILITPENDKDTLKPVFCSDFSSEKYPVRMPLYLPPTRYSPTDMPWSKNISYGDVKDSLGCSYNI